MALTYSLTCYIDARWYDDHRAGLHQAAPTTPELPPQDAISHNFSNEVGGSESKSTVSPDPPSGLTPLPSVNTEGASPTSAVESTKSETVSGHDGHQSGESTLETRPSSWRLCFGYCIQAKSRFIASNTQDFASGEVTFTWHDNDLEATILPHAFEPEDVLPVTGGMVSSPIELQQTLTAEFNRDTGTWVSQVSSTDYRCPDDAIRFSINKAAACLLTREVNGQRVPYYISPVLLPPSGKVSHVIRPDPQVFVWFGRGVQNGTMIFEKRFDPYLAQDERSDDAKTPTDLLSTAAPEFVRKKYRVLLSGSGKSYAWFDSTGCWQHRRPDDFVPVQRGLVESR